MTEPPSSSLQCGLSDDLLKGADAVAAFLFGDKRFRRRVYNLVETGQIPHFRLGMRLCCRKSVLLEWIARQEATGVQSNGSGSLNSASANEAVSSLNERPE